jgi:hypothetical protein
MSVAATQPEVGTDATLILANGGDRGGADAGTVKALLRNETATATVFLGDAAVTIAAFPWKTTDGPLEIELEPGEALYGIVDETPQTLHVLKQGR